MGDKPDRPKDFIGLVWWILRYKMKELLLILSIALLLFLFSGVKVTTKYFYWESPIKIILQKNL